MGGAQQGEDGASQQQQHRHHDSHSRSSRRRNTVHSTSAGNSSTAPWPPLPVNHTPPQPILVPLYSPLWQLTQLNHFNQHHTILQSAWPLMTALPFPQQDRAVPASSRPGSPPRRGRSRRARSPDLPATHDEQDTDLRSPNVGEPSSARPRPSKSPNGEDTFSSLPVRPPLGHHASSVSHHSNSVPNTPRQRPRKLSLNTTSALPPHDDDGAHSPRSVHSESNSHLPPLRRPPSGCRFETAMAFPRRRMPYSLGGDRLEKVKAGVKRCLHPDEEKKLSGDMRELYDRLLPSAESEQRRAKFIRKLEQLLNTQWPGNNIEVRVFGSSGNLLFTSDSDVDVCVVTPMKELEQVCMLAKVLAEHGMERVVCVSHAKVPIVKMWDPELQLACDLNVNNTLALENTRMIKTYVEIDPRVRPLAMVIKHWTKRRVLNEAAFGGTLSSYTWICMILNFLQTRDPPILPSLHQRPHQKRVGVHGPESSFADDLDVLRGYGRANTQTLGELLFQFFRYYGHEVDYEKDVISVRQGKLISKEGKGWHLMQNNRICVEEPFNVGRNLGNTADDASFRGVHLELRRAFTLLADDVDLAACCEQYIFPPEEERVWEKPLSQPRPVLSRSASQSGRGRRGGAGASRGGRPSGNQNHRLPLAARRASGSAALGQGLGSVAAYPAPGLSMQDSYRQAQAQLKLRDQLYESYQALQIQEQELRLIQAQARAASQVQARNEASLRRSTQGHPTYLNGPLGGSTGNIDPPPHTAPLRPDVFFYPLQYLPSQPYYPAGTSTNPSSPSIAPTVPEPRRSAQRTQVADGSTHASLRSHSQPARSVPSPLRLHAVPARTSRFDDALRSPPSDLRQEYLLGEAGYPRNKPSPDSRQAKSGGRPSRSDSVPKEYVGYYVEGSPLIQQRQYDDLILRPVPAFGDLTHVPLPMPIEESTAENLHDLPQHVSQSPVSWDQALETRNTARSASMMTARSQPNEQHVTEPVREGRGPLIVDGSTSLPSTDAQSYRMSVSESASTSDDQGYDTPETTSDSHSQEHADIVGSGSLQQTHYAPAFADPNLYAEHGRPQVVSSTPLTMVPGRDFAAPNFVVTSSGPSPTLRAAPQFSAGPNASALVTRDSTAGASPPSSPRLPNGSPRSPGYTPLERIPLLSVGKGLTEAQQLNLQPAPPLLSPVMETSPSPSSGKKFDYFPDAAQPKVNGIRDAKRGIKGKEPQPPPTPASSLMAQQGLADHHYLPSADVLSTRPNGHVAHVAHVPNGWQQPNLKQRKASKSASSKKIPGSGVKTQQAVEATPTNELERKGG